MREQQPVSEGEHDNRTRTRAPKWLQLSWGDRDRHRWITVLAALGVLVAAALAAFGLPPVDLHPPFHRLGIMDPLCGGTRSARYTAMGRFDEAWRYNPLGILAVVGAALAVARAVIGFATRHWINLVFGWTPRRRRIAIVVVVILAAGLEIRQQLRADLLIAGT